MSSSDRNVRAMIQERFSGIAQSALKEKRFPVGTQSAKTLGYNPQEIDKLPPAIAESFAGVGNPLSLGALTPGQMVLDLGCGAGLDSILAAKRVGPAGRVVGVDFTEEMVQKARNNLAILALSNIDFLYADLHNLLAEDNTFDVAISNGVFNLCQDKPKAFVEAFRVLKPGGRLWMADILLEGSVTPEEVARLGAWSD